MTGLDNPVATGGTALLATLAIQFLKNSQWASWFTRETKRANLVLSVVVAVATSLGIHFAWDAAKDTLVITGLMGGLTHGAWEALLQWAAQHATYKAFVVPAETLGEIRALLARQLPPPVSEGAAKALQQTSQSPLATRSETIGVLKGSSAS